MISDKNEVVNFRIEYNKLNWDGKTNEIDVLCDEQMTRQGAFSQMWYMINFHTIGKSANYFVNGVEVDDCLKIWDSEESRSIFD